MRQDDEASSAYAAVLRDLIQDAERRQQMSAASRARILEHFTLEQMGTGMEQIIGEAIQLKSEKGCAPVNLQPGELLMREARYVVEYLQAKQKYRELERQFSEWIKPHSASFWFYLWLRQLFLPMYSLLEQTKFRGWLLGLKGHIKRMLIAKTEGNHERL
jgi:uncharacterized protein (UPF0297 family)